MAKKTAKKTTKKTAKKATAKRGRKSMFPGIDQEQVKKLVVSGHDDAFCADFFGVSLTTWNNWKNKHPEFFEKLKDWKAAADDDVERSLYELATGFEHPETKVFCNEGLITTYEVTRRYAPNATAAIFWLKNRRPKQWRDKQELEHTGMESLAEEIVKARARAGIK